MASRSLGELIAKIKADASQFVAELNRADNVLRRKATDMDKELGKIGKKFTLPDISKDILRGVGIGSGFAVAQTAAEQISGFWERSAKAAESIAESSERSLKAVLETIRLRQSPEQQRTSLEKDLARLQREYIDAAKPLDFAALGMPELPADSPVFDEQRQKLAALAAQMNEVGAAIAKITKEIDDTTKKAADRTAEEGAKRIIQANEWRLQVQREYNTALEKEAAALMSTLATPQEEHAARLRRIETLYQAGKLSAEEYTRALTASFRKLDSEELEAVNKKLKEFFEPLDEQSDKNFKAIEERARAFSSAMANMWDSVGDRAGDAFADMVLTGENAFKKLPEMAARMALNIAARMAIINPLMNAIFGGFGGWNPLPSFFGSGAPPAGGGKAIGGPVSAGTAYMVGERGREMFVPSVPGTIVTAEKTEQMMGGGNTYVIDARGTDESVIQRLAAALQQLAGPGVVERRALSAVSDRNARMAF